MHKHIIDNGGLGGKISGAGGGGFLYEIIEKSRQETIVNSINPSHMLRVKHEPIGSRLLAGRLMVE